MSDHRLYKAIEAGHLYERKRRTRKQQESFNLRHGVIEIDNDIIHRTSVSSTDSSFNDTTPSINVSISNPFYDICTTLDSLLQLESSRKTRETDLPVIQGEPITMFSEVDGRNNLVD